MAYDPNNPFATISPSDMPSSGVGVSRTPTVGVRAGPQFGPPIPAGGLPTSQPDYSVFDSMDPRQDPAGPSSPMPSTRVQGNPFFNFLSALFGHSGGSPQQGMTGLLARGQSAPGTNQLGNPFNRFG